LSRSSGGWPQRQIARRARIVQKVGKIPPTAVAVVAAALAVVGCGGGTKTVTAERTVTGPAAQSTATDRAHAPSRAEARTVNEATFQSPTGNIGCVLVAEVARCDIVKRSWSPPPRPSDCQLDFGQGIAVGRSGKATFVCAGDTARAPGSKKLAYGTQSQVGDFTCVSRFGGMTCTNRSTGHGFRISAQSYKLF
jgi:hypothetical protein